MIEFLCGGGGEEEEEEERVNRALGFHLIIFSCF